MTAPMAYDYIVVGAGSAGCAVAAGLAERQAGSVAVIEAGPSDAHPFVKIPMALMWLMGSRRDWRFKSAPMAGVNGRRINIPRGRMVGGSGSINSMVWFRGRASDFDGWNVPGWSWADVEPAFEEVEAKITPNRLAAPHPLTDRLHRLFGGNGAAPPSPDYESAGVCHFNMRNSRRWSAADAFLRPAASDHDLTVITGRIVRRLHLDKGCAKGVILGGAGEDTVITARKGVILSAGAIGSPDLLLRSGIGPADSVTQQTVVVDGVGQNLHDHPGCGMHFAGAETGYGLTLKQAGQWLAAPLNLMRGRGPLASPTVEGAAFFNARGDGSDPDVQSHFIPFFMNHAGHRYAPGSGYFADVCVCRPKSRGRLMRRNGQLHIDLGLFKDEADLDTLTHGLFRLRSLMADAMGDAAAPEVYPAGAATSHDDMRAHVRANAGTAYHPVGTLRMGTDPDAPVTPTCDVRGVGSLWAADASLMPAVTSANTNAPAMMIGHRAASFIAA
ncbi:GMC family oxidoreductase [Pseudooctadecabacter jejudonensis]|uniref:Alcohol dehydrogenase [acceptor] n=1 Tax=Pseudooctadecabacter jejudonensis TaxID=1391910 RepID=A0A1Y5SLG1_9RHOB|nr:GMC family oxidoreductase N-terminal domain-containing protein [Pseudooctadecabacter jejudonensis]SLN40404.1 Alcohol dehydrogenase [acceptor] [Pseudooctadecabacter jejudonensis]